MVCWTQEEIQYLKTNYNKLNINIVSKNLNKTNDAVTKKARKLKLKSKFYWNDIEIDDLIKNYNIGKSVKEISVLTNRTPQQIRFKLKKLKIYKLEQTKWTKEDKEYMLNNFSKVLPKDAEEHLGRKWSAIYEYGNGILKLGRDGSVVRYLHSKSNIGKTKKYAVNSDYFSKLNRENSYVLGFLLTDGCMGKRAGRNYFTLHLGLQSNDRYILENISNKMKSTYPIYDYKNGKSYMSAFKIRDQKICSDLLNLKMVPRKSLILECPDIPNEYVADFVRGVIDGDGTISFKKPRMTIYSASKLFVDGVEKLLKNVGIKSYINVTNMKGNSCYMLRVGRISDIMKLYKMMYEDSDLFLSRKKNIFEQIYDKYHEKYATK